MGLRNCSQGRVCGYIVASLIPLGVKGKLKGPMQVLRKHLRDIFCEYIQVTILPQLRRYHIYMLFIIKFIWKFQIIVVLLQHQNPPSLSTMLKCAGRFINYNTMNIKVTFSKEYMYPFLQIPKSHHSFKQ